MRRPCGFIVLSVHNTVHSPWLLVVTLLDWTEAPALIVSFIVQYNPPVQRNAPPVAGNIMWARQLLRRIEGPMQKFEQNKSIMGTKESRRIVKTYNRVARALIEFEALWNQAWLKSVESVWQVHSSA